MQLPSPDLDSVCHLIFAPLIGLQQFHTKIPLLMACGGCVLTIQMEQSGEVGPSRRARTEKLAGEGGGGGDGEFDIQPGSRLHQIVEWLGGQGGECMIVLDECHKAKNLMNSKGASPKLLTGRCWHLYTIASFHAFTLTVQWTRRNVYLRLAVAFHIITSVCSLIRMVIHLRALYLYLQKTVGIAMCHEVHIAERVLLTETQSTPCVS